MTRAPGGTLCSSAGLQGAEHFSREGWRREDKPENVLQGLVLKFPIPTLWCQGNPSSPTQGQGHVRGENNITRHQC